MVSFVVRLDVLENVREDLVGVGAKNEIQMTKVGLVVNEWLWKKRNKRLNVFGIAEVIFRASKESYGQLGRPIGEIELRRESLTVFLHVAIGSIVVHAKSAISNTLGPVRHVFNGRRVGLVLKPEGKLVSLNSRKRPR